MNTVSIVDKLTQVEERYEELERLLADPEVATDYNRVREYAQERAGIAELVEASRQYRSVQQELESTQSMLDDELGDEMRALVEQEIQQLQSRADELQQRLRLLLVPKDPLDEKNILSALNNRNPLPPSFNVRLDDPDNLESVQAALAPPGASGEPQPISSAIEEIVTAEETEQIREVTGAVKILLAVIAVLLGIASLFLIGNTIRLSIYARRREVEVMRLVGATRWFIRWPFMLEGVVVGAAGGLVAILILWLGKITIVDPLSKTFHFLEAQNAPAVNFPELVVILFAAAVLVSTLGSGLTLRRFLKV